MDTIIYFITYTVTLLVGYFLGNKKPTLPENIVSTIKESLPQRESTVGVVKRLDAQQIRYNKSMEKEGDQEMEKTLDEILDVQND